MKRFLLASLLVAVASTKAPAAHGLLCRNVEATPIPGRHAALFTTYEYCMKACIDFGPADYTWCNDYCSQYPHGDEENLTRPPVPEGV